MKAYKAYDVNGDCSTMVRDMGWSCNEPSWECDTCEAKEWCRWNEEE